MIIHRVRVSGFQIIADPIELDFPEKGRIGIFGTNESGKTTLMEAVEYALYGLRRGSAAEESRENIITWGKEEAEVEVEFTSGQDRFLLTRTFNIRGEHRARLIPMVDGQKNVSDALTSLTEIETKVEQITGMDRESFKKLVYIKQKDLDALKGLVKAKREQLVNKVMGIEIFDEAARRVKDDVSQLAEDIRNKETELTSVRENVKSYREKLAQKDALNVEVKNLEQQLSEKTTTLETAKSTLSGYAWLYAFNSKIDLVASRKEERNRARLDIDRIERLKQDKTKYETTVTACEPEVFRLETARERLVRLENTLEEHRSALNRLNAMREDAIQRANLTPEQRELSSRDIQKPKEHQLIQFMLMLVLSVVLIVTGVLTQLILSALGVVLVAIAAILYVRYRRVDTMLSLTANIQVLNKQIEDYANRVQDVNKQIVQFAAESGFKNHIEVDGALSRINEELMRITGQSSIQGVEALAQSAYSEIKRMEEFDLSASLQNLNHEIDEKQNEIKELEKAKPTTANNLQYDAAAHRDAQMNVDHLQEETGALEKESQRKLGIVSQLETDLRNLKRDYDRLAGLETEHGVLKDKQTMLGLVLEELGETSKKLRMQVMPQARLIINQILPILTDGRYSEFEITEDLKFKAHSIEAGGYKEREIFSGGTQDQFLIALRLAFTESILDSRVMADRYCLLMDECISSSDDQRKQGIFEVLDAMKNTFSQIFIISHEDISTLTDHHIVLSRNRRGYAEIRSKSW